MNHREFLQSLTPQQRQQLTEKSDAQGLRRLLQHWLVIIALSSLIVLKVTAWPLLMLPLGIMLVFQFTLLHEAIHFTPFKTRWLNTAVAQVCGYLLLIPPRWFRHFHLEHHRQTHVPGKDPELDSPKPSTRRAYLWHISGLPLWWGLLKGLWTQANGRCADAYIPESEKAVIQQEAVCMVMCYLFLLIASVILGSGLLLVLWVFPLLLGQPLLRLYLMAEHTGCPQSNNMFSNTRTVYTHAMVRWLAWNMPYHAEHHSYAAVPFYRLPQLHRLTAEYLASTSSGYTSFHQAYLKTIV